jgi:acyl dehydratase
MSGEDLPPSPFRVGERFEKPLLLDAQSIRNFATMVGDTNPLHHDEAFARTSRFGGLIASGVQTSAMMAAFTAGLVTDRAPSLGLEVQFRFRKAVKVDEPLLIAWEVTAIEAKPKLNGHIVTFEGKMTDGAGAVVLTGQVRTLVMKDWPLEPASD